jgi:hypothetical protein
MDVVTNGWRKRGAILSMSLSALASDDPRSFEKKTREDYKGTTCVFSDMTYDPQSTHIGYERLFW